MGEWREEGKVQGGREGLMEDGWTDGIKMIDDKWIEGWMDGDI